MIISVVMTAVTLYAIWRFSAQDSSETMATSGELAWKVWQKLQAVFSGWGYELSLLKVEAVLRKLAHFGIFMMLGVGLTGIFVWQRRVPVAVVVILVGVVCAVMDELHQSFVPGRNPAMFDVLIDTLGVCVGMGIVLLVTRGMRRRRDGDKDTDTDLMIEMPDEEE